MKIIAIGDTHGRNTWESFKDRDVDKFVFMGDYFDSFNIPYLTQIKNFRRIIQFKKDCPDRVVLLFGNHEFHYLRGFFSTYSGYQYVHSFDIEEIINDNLGVMQVGYQWENILFTHAGVTNTWLKHWKASCTEDSLNTLFLEKRGPFAFQSLRYTMDPCGDNVEQGPLWVRPASLLSDLPENIIQVVGHTYQKDLILESVVKFIDVLDSVSKVLYIEDGAFSVIEIGKSADVL